MPLDTSETGFSVQTNFGCVAGADGESADHIGFIDPQTRSLFGRSDAAEPDVLVAELARDEANDPDRYATLLLDRGASAGPMNRYLLSEADSCRQQVP